MRREAQANVKPIRQRTQWTCMAASMAMCLNALDHKCDEDEVNKVMGATPMKGAAWEQALACAQHYGCRATLTTPATVKQLKEWTDAGVPVMIAWNPEGRDWSHASVVFHVDEDWNVHVADPNLPDPDETVRVVPKGEFYKKWYEKWPSYLVRRPACAIAREVTSEGRQVMASRTPSTKGKTDHADGTFTGHWAGYKVTLQDGSVIETSTGNRSMRPGLPVEVVIQRGRFSVFPVQRRQRNMDEQSDWDQALRDEFGLNRRASAERVASKKSPQPTTRTQQEKEEDKNRIRGKAPKKPKGHDYVEQVHRRPGSGSHRSRERERDVEKGRSRKPKHTPDWRRASEGRVAERYDTLKDERLTGPDYLEDRESYQRSTDRVMHTLMLKFIRNFDAATPEVDLSDVIQKAQRKPVTWSWELKDIWNKYRDLGKAHGEMLDSVLDGGIGHSRTAIKYERLAKQVRGRRASLKNVLKRHILGETSKTAEPYDCYKDGLRGRALADCYKQFPDDLGSDDIALIRRYYPGWSPHERRYYDSTAQPLFQWAEIAELMDNTSNAKFIRSVAEYVRSKGYTTPKQQAVLDRVRKRYVKQLADPEGTLQDLREKKRLRNEEEARLKDEARTQQLDMMESVSALGDYDPKKWARPYSGFHFAVRSVFDEGPYHAEVFIDYGRFHLLENAGVKVEKDGKELYSELVPATSNGESIQVTEKERNKFQHKVEAFVQGLIAADIQGKPLGAVSKPRVPAAPASSALEKEAPAPTGERHTWDKARTQKMIEILDSLIDKTGMGMLKGFKRDLETGKGLTENQLKAIRHQLYRNRMRAEAGSFKMASMSLEEIVSERYAASQGEFDWRAFGTALRVALSKTPVPPRKVTGEVWGERVDISLQFGRDYFDKKGGDDDRVQGIIDKVAKKHGLTKKRWNMYVASDGTKIEVSVAADSYGGNPVRLAAPEITKDPAL